MTSFIPKSIIVALALVVFSLPVFSWSRSTQSLEGELGKRLAEINGQIFIYRVEIDRLSKANRSLEDETQLLDSNIGKLALQMEANQIVAADLRVQAQALEEEIVFLEGNIEEAKNKLSGNITSLYQLDQRSLVEVIFSGKEFADFYSQISYLRQIQNGIKADLAGLSGAKEELGQTQEELDERLAAQERLVALQYFEQEEMEQAKLRKAGLINKNVAATVSLQSKTISLEEVAGQLRDRLYVIKGVTSSLELDDVYAKASFIASQVNIDPAFLMAVLKVESDVGNNVGGGHWQKDMHPRDRAAFLQITQKLGLDPDVMPVSSKPRYGWGGAMGPAQFLPNTWVAYEGRVAILTGHNPPNPWNLDDAFAAAAIKLSAGGADRRTREGEWESAMRYFAGSRWQNPAYSFYGDRVMTVKDLIAGQF